MNQVCSDRAFAVFLTVCFAVLGCVSCAPQDPLAALMEGERGRVVRVLDGDTLALNTGLVVRLVCVTAPNAKDVYGKESTRILEDLTQGRMVTLHYGGLTRDKFGRALAHVRTVDNLGPKLWINQALIQQGAGWVDVYPDTVEACAPLVEDELATMDARQGLWRKRDYRPINAETCCGERGVKFISGTIEEARSGADWALRDEPGRDTFQAQKCTLRLTHLPFAVVYAGGCLPQHTKAKAMIHVRGYFTGEKIDARHPMNVRVQSSGSEN